MKNKEISRGLREKYERNKRIYEITLNELEQNKSYRELSYPEVVEVDIKGKINYKVFIKELKDSLKRLRKHLRLIPKSSILTREKEERLRKHHILLKELKEKKEGE